MIIINHCDARVIRNCTIRHQQFEVIVSMPQGINFAFHSFNLVELVKFILSSIMPYNQHQYLEVSLVFFSNYRVCRNNANSFKGFKTSCIE